RNSFVGCDLKREQEAEFPDMDVSIIETGNECTSGEVNPLCARFGSGFDFSQRTNGENMTIIADEQGFSMRKIGVYGVDYAIVKEHHGSFVVSIGHREFHFTPLV